jgi:hypothetical protein
MDEVLKSPCRIGQLGYRSTSEERVIQFSTG